MPVLTRDKLKERLIGENFRNNFDRGLVITPLLDLDRQIGVSSIDIRLGNEFLIIRQTNFPSVNPAFKDEITDKIGKYQERVRVGFGEEFVLHPNQLALGCTLEYIAMPSDLSANVVGRSSWGRLGLIIATATAVAPGFKGVITLELLNAGLVPLILYPGVIIAQLIFEEMSADTPSYSGRYNFPTGPEFSKIHLDYDIDFWGNSSKFKKR